MPLVAHTQLPSFQRLHDEGRTVLTPDRAKHQDIRELHIGLLNMMPDAALCATERQFFRLVGESNQIAQIYMHPFTLPELHRSDDTKEYIKKYYESFEQIKENGLDALIVTGANVSQPDLTLEPFWQPLQDIFDWAWDNVASTMCSCLATHAIMQNKYNQHRQETNNGKLWGVYRHRVMGQCHPLVRHMNTVFDVPHSRNNKITREQFDAAGMRTLVASKESGVHIAVSGDGIRLVCMQGHPEYDAVSLLKEYTRELGNFSRGARGEAPPYPENYFTEELRNYLATQDISHLNAEDIQALQDKLSPLVENTWTDSARTTIASWIGLVYQITNVDRKKQFMDGLNPNDPLGLYKTR